MLRLLTLLQEAHQAAPADDHAAGGGLGPFAVEPGLIIWTWLVFIALFFLLKRFAWPAILKSTEERERRIANQLAEAERLNAEAQKALAENQRLLAGARDQALALLNEAKQAAQQERELAVRKTREEQEQVLDRARREIEAERERAIATLRREAVDLSLAAASRLIEEKVDSEANRKLVTDYLSSLGAHKH